MPVKGNARVNRRNDLGKRRFGERVAGRGSGCRGNFGGDVLCGLQLLRSRCSKALDLDPLSIEIGLKRGKGRLHGIIKLPLGQSREGAGLEGFNTKGKIVSPCRQIG